MDNLIAFYTVFRREIFRFFRIWTQTLLPPVITMTLYFVIFGNLIGPRIGEMNGFPYIEYMVPGLIMMSIITSAYTNVVFSFFSSKFQRFVEELLVAPVSFNLVIWGYVLGGTVRGIICGILVACVALFFSTLHLENIGITLVVGILTAILFSLAGLLNAIYAKKFDDINIVPTFILTPLTYLGGVFYSVTLLAPFWQGITRANPIFYMVNAFRYGMLGISDVNIWIALGVILIFIAFFYLICLGLLVRGTGIKS